MSSKKRIAVILPSLYNKGPVILALRIIESLKEEFEFTVFYFDPNPELKPSVEFFQINFFNRKDFSGFDLIHTHMLRPDVYTWLMRIDKQVKTVSTLHQYLDFIVFAGMGWFKFVLTKQVWLRSLSTKLGVVCINPHMQELYAQDPYYLKTFYSPNGVGIYTDGLSSNSFALPATFEGKKMILTIGNLEKNKGFERILPLLKMNSSFAWICIGDGPERSNLEDEAHRLGVSKSVFFAGFVKDPFTKLPKVDVFVSASHSEGFGMAITEAIVNKIPIVSSDLPSLRSLFNEDEITFFNLADPNALSDAVTLALSEVGSAKTLKAFERVKRDYDLKAMAKCYLSIYNKLLQGL